MSPKLRLIDIAKKANVSLGTVDRVVNNRGKAAPKTEKLIREIINEFGYEPNLRASSLSSKKKTKFAVLVPKPHGEDYWYKILYGIRTAEKAFAEFGVEISEFLYDEEDDIQFREMALQILNEYYTGVLLVPVFHKEALEFVQELEQRNISYVFIDSIIEGTSPLCSISQNDFQSGVLAAKLLDYCMEGGDEILMVSHLTHTDNYDVMQERLNGFKSYFEYNAKGKRLIRFLDIINPKYEKLAILLKEELKQYPNIKGIFKANSRVYWVARYLSENNISGIKLVGFDLIEQNIRYLKDGIIEFILFDYAQNQGQLGLQILFDHILKKKEIVHRINMPIHIVTKENLEGFLV